MSTGAVLVRNSPRIGRPSSRTSNPMDQKKNVLKSEEASKKSSPLEQKASLPAPSEPKESHPQSEESKPVQTSEPLAPPPRPSQQGASEGDYFSGNHGTGSGSHFALEPNPFDKSFGASDQTPGGTLLPPVASLTSPALPGSNNPGGYTWPNSLRSGPLSPAMLAGPAGSGDYFTDGLSRGFPTPNESSLRTGLTPGGGGSMFPAPSPNSQAIYQQLQSGGATPSTLDFHRTALNAAARNKPAQFTSNPQDSSQQNTANMDHSVHGDATDAANGLFMLAKGGPTNGNFAVPSQPQAIQSKASTTSQDPGVMDKRASRNGNSIGSYSGPDISGAGSDSHEESKPTTRGKGKKNTKAQTQSTGRRKADDTPQKGGNKKAKGNHGQPSNVDPNLEPDSHLDEDDSGDDDLPQDTRKMTDEEKRKNFLERNRVAALKCRQRKKQWLANLQHKVELFSSENDALSAQVQQLREEIVNLKTLLLAHKDCPVSQQQGIPNLIMNSMSGDPNMAGYPNPHANPYGMAAMQNGHPQGMAQTASMQR